MKVHYLKVLLLSLLLAPLGAHAANTVPTEDTSKGWHDPKVTPNLNFPAGATAPIVTLPGDAAKSAPPPPGSMQRIDAGEIRDGDGKWVIQKLAAQGVASRQCSAVYQDGAAVPGPDSVQTIGFENGKIVRKNAAGKVLENNGATAAQKDARPFSVVFIMYHNVVDPNQADTGMKSDAAPESLRVNLSQKGDGSAQVAIGKQQIAQLRQTSTTNASGVIKDVPGFLAEIKSSGKLNLKLGTASYDISGKSALDVLGKLQDCVKDETVPKAAGK